MLRDYINYLLNHIMKSTYVVPNNTALLLKRLMTAYERKKMSEEDVLNEFIAFLETLTKIEKPHQATHKINYITDTIDITPTNILDIGAGTGEILAGIKNHYKLPTEKVYALELQPIQRDDITVIGYDTQETIQGAVSPLRIPFEDNSIDLIVMLSLLHHIEPTSRLHLLKEVYRVLSPNGRVIIREHDDNKSRLYYIFIQLMHYVWYIRNNETRDALYMMSRKETLNLFKEVGFKSHKDIQSLGVNHQRLYGEVYKKI